LRPDRPIKIASDGAATPLFAADRDRVTAVFRFIERGFVQQGPCALTREPVERAP
jgi:hypothetical protein